MVKTSHSKTQKVSTVKCQIIIKSKIQVEIWTQVIEKDMFSLTKLPKHKKNYILVLQKHMRVEDEGEMLHGQLSISNIEFSIDED